jgi:hypothetical protein
MHGCEDSFALFLISVGWVIPKVFLLLRAVFVLIISSKHMECLVRDIRNNPYSSVIEWAEKR